MKRGEIWALRDTSYATKARPVVVVQNDVANSFGSMALCLSTTFDSQDISTRVEIQPTEGNGLMQPSYVMTDKIVTVDRAMFGERIGAFDSRMMETISAKLALVLGLSKTP